MPTPLNASQYEIVGGDAGPTGPAAGTQLKPLDASNVETLPSYADGSSPLTPVNKSPVPMLDRMKLSLGNDKGKLDYLKNNFEDAQMNPQGDMVVKDQGIWHRVSPSLGEHDAWETTKKIIGTFTPPVLRAVLEKSGGHMPGVSLDDIGGKLADNVGPAMDVAGGVAGAAAGMGVGSVATAGAGGAVAEAARSSLGRLAGTYEATPEQQLKDIGWEGLLNSGGQAVALGMKPTVGLLKNALEPYAQSATNFAKETMATLWGHATGAGKWAVRRAMDDPDAIMPKVQSALATIGRTVSPDEAVGVAKSQQINIVRALASESKDALQTQYRQGLSDVMSNVGKDFSADVGQMITNVQQKMADAGYGTFVSQRASRGAVAPISASLEDAAAEAGPKTFKLFTPEQIAQNMGTTEGQLPKLMGENTRASMQEMVNLTNQYAKAGTLKGADGARKLIDFKKAVGETFSDLLSGTDVPPTIQRAVMGVKQDMEEQIAQQFANHSEQAGQAYLSMNEKYSASADAVRKFTDAVKQGTEENLVPQLVSKAGSNRMLKDEALTTAQLIGPKGNTMMQSLLDWEAAKGFFNYVPKSLDGNSATTIGKLAGMVTQQSNPRAVGAQIAYGNKALDFFKSLGGGGARAFLSNDKAVQAFSQSLMQGYAGEEPGIESMLKQAGVK